MNLLTHVVAPLAVHVGSVLLVLAMGHDWPVPARHRRQGR